MKIKHIFLLIFFLNTSFIFAANTGKITGIVVDKATQEPLANTNVIVIGSQFGAATDEAGRFLINNLPPGTYALQAERIDYEPETISKIKLLVGGEKEVKFELTSRIIQMKAVSVEANKFSFKYQTEVAQIGLQRLEPRRVSQIPGMLDDISRAVQIFGSVMPASDYNAYFAVRGGSPEQNLVVMDGVVIPNPYRFRLLLGGGISLFDPAITEDVRLHIGGFSAEFGNFLSSVLEVDTRDGNQHEFSGRFSLNLIDASAVLEGPIGNGMGSWLVSGRRTYYDLLANRFSKNNATYPNTSDLNAKLVFNLNARNKISFRMMNCAESTEMLSEISDELNVTEESNIRVTSLDWLNTATDKLTHRFTVAVYEEKFDYLMAKPEERLQGEVISESSVYSQLDSDMLNFSVREDVIYELSDKIWMTRGIYFSSVQSDIDFKMPQRTISFGRREFPPPTIFNDPENYVAFYMDDIYKLNPGFHIKAGLRYDYSSLNEKSSINPRLSTWLKLHEHFSLDTFWGICTQNPNVLSSFVRNLPADFSSVIHDLDPERAMHFTVGSTIHISENIHGKLDLYYKKFDDLILPDNTDEKLAENSGVGYSKGIEFYIQKKQTPASFWSGIMSYSYGKSEYKYEDKNIWFPSSYDRRHSFSVMSRFRLLENLSANFLWRISSGLPYTRSYGILFTDAAYPNEFLKYNTSFGYFPNYQRLDFRLNYEHRGQNMAFMMYVDVTNLYNHHNVYDQTWEVRKLEEAFSELKVAKMRTFYMLPLVPSFGVSVAF